MSPGAERGRRYHTEASDHNWRGKGRCSRQIEGGRATSAKDGAGIEFAFRTSNDEANRTSWPARSRMMPLAEVACVAKDESDGGSWPA